MQRKSSLSPLFGLQCGERKIKMEKKYFIHPTAIVDEGAEIGEGTKIWHFTHIMSGAKIGENCIIGQNVFIGSGVLLGNDVKVQNNVSIYDGVILEDDVFCGPSMVFTNVFNPRSFISRKERVSEDLGKKRSHYWCQCDDCLWKYDWSVCFYRSWFCRDQECSKLCFGLWKSRKSEGMGLPMC